MNNRLGLHWLRVHPDNNVDLPFVKRFKPASIKLFLPAWSDANFCADLLRVAPPDCLFVARDHEMSEQKEDMWRDPGGTGVRHAGEWLHKIQGGQYHLPPNRSCFLGINEPDATHGDRTAIDIYTAAFLTRLASDHQIGGAFNFSTGHPRTIDGTGSTAPDYAFFERSHEAIVKGHHYAVQHIYGAASQPCVPGHYDRLKSCPWRDVVWIIGECGIDEHVVTGGEHDGFTATLHPNDAYPFWMERLITGLNDRRIHSWQPFTYDYSKPWATFDVRTQNDAFLAWNWQGLEDVLPGPGPTPPPVQPGPGPTPPPQGQLVHPVKGAPLTQHWGERGEYYKGKYPGLWGHNGTDLAPALGTPVKALSGGTVEMASTDKDYGKYIRINHPALEADSFYAHLDSTSVRSSDVVSAGQQIGTVGSTGNSTGPHLHLEIRLRNGAGYKVGTPMPKGRVDPETYCIMNGLRL